MVKCSPGICSRIVNKLLAAATQFQGKAMDSMEERQAKLTTFRTIDRWFDEWERQLLQLGFAETDVEGVSVVSKEKKKRIINIDETALSFDGAEGCCGGRPTIQFSDPNLQASYRRTLKSSMTIIMITGCSSAREAIPPHFQCPTRAKEDTAKIKNDVFKYLKRVLGVFGAGST